MSDTEQDTTPPMQLFSGEPQHQNFPRLMTLFPSSRMEPAATPYIFPEAERIDLPKTYRFDGQDRSITDFIPATDTAALLVLKGGAIRYEDYWLTGGRDVQWISWSIAKSYVSAMVGIAIQEGFIKSVEEPISDYVTTVRGSSYDGVRIKDMLQMSSGTRWNEDYSDLDAEIHQFNAVYAGGTSLEEFFAGLVREKEPGTLCQYNSAETQVLGMLVAKATGRSLTDYMQEKICEPLGMESPSYWLLDNTNMEMAFGGLNMTARDFARIGELYRNKGQWQGKQILEADWVTASVTPDAPHLQAGKVIVGGHVLPLGYGYQWWIPDGEDGEFSAIGVYNQFIYVDPSRDVVIVKQSANRTYGISGDEKDNQEMENIEFLRTVARSMD